MRCAFLKFALTSLRLFTLQLGFVFLFGACLCPSLSFDGWYADDLAPLSATINTIQATHSQHHTLLNSYKMVRSPLLCSHLLQYRRLMVLLLQALCPAHCYHAVQSAHKSLRVPPVMAQVMSCRSLKRSRSSHSLSSYSAAESRLLFPSRLSHQCPSHFWMLLCRRLHLVTSPRRCRRRRLINRIRFRVTWQCRRLPTVPISHPWMLPRRRPHPTPCTQHRVSACLYADGFSISFLVFC